VHQLVVAETRERPADPHEHKDEKEGLGKYDYRSQNILVILLVLASVHLIYWSAISPHYRLQFFLVPVGHGASKASNFILQYVGYIEEHF
jgi:hypothetical protein